MSILVTGSGGHLGRALARARWSRAPVLTTKGDVDVCDDASLEAAFAMHRPAVVIHAAAYARVDAAESSVARAFEVNRDGASKVAMACARFGAALVYLSTDQAFSGEGAPFRENDVVAPQNAYARSKVEGEIAVRRALERHLIVRTAWLLSADGRNFVSSLFTMGAEQALTLVHGRRANPTPVDALAERLVEIAERIAGGEELAWGNFHVVGKPAASLVEVAEAIFAMRRARGEAVPRFEVVEGSHREGEAARPEDSSLATAHTEQALGIDMPAWRERL